MERSAVFPQHHGMTRGSRRILVAIEPRVLADTLAIMLRARGDEAVVDLTASPSTDAGGYDLMITSQIPSGEGVDVGLAVPMLDRDRPVWGGHVTVTVNDAHDLLRQLDQHLPGTFPRAPT